MQRLRRRADFLAASGGVKAHGAAIIVAALDHRSDLPPRVGFTVSKKVGNAVERNRVRRRLREIVRLAAADRFRKGLDYVIIARRAALAQTYGSLVSDVARAFDRVNERGRHADHDKVATRRGKADRRGPGIR
ncbi:MAG: ribonuclease P protein component [Proteobacteria bacterium]|nr:ribonuclease P protein component [Pseudomonadota bacterium]